MDATKRRPPPERGSALLSHHKLRAKLTRLSIDCSLAAAAAAEVRGRCVLSVSTHTCTVDVYITSPSPSIKSTICRGSTPTHTLIHVHVPHWSRTFGMIAFKTGCTRTEGEQTASCIRMHLLQREASSMYGCKYVCMYACRRILFRNQRRDVKAHEVVPSSCTLSFLCLSYPPLPKCLHAF